VGFSNASASVAALGTAAQILGGVVVVVVAAYVVGQ